MGHSYRVQEVTQEQLDVGVVVEDLVVVTHGKALDILGNIV